MRQFSLYVEPEVADEKSALNGGCNSCASDPDAQLRNPSVHAFFKFRVQARDDRGARSMSGGRLSDERYT